jgi:TonB-linked SusC/RagA family outer membrane protein
MLMKKKVVGLYLLQLFSVFIISLFNAMAQDRIISGTVVDESTNEPLVGVTIMVKGTNKGTVTDLNGIFQISADIGSILQVSYVGYEEQEIKVTGDRISIRLRESIQQLDEVIVVGYGTMKKRDITGAITSVDSKLIEERNPVNVFDALQGAAPGVTITSSSGAPGASFSVQVRGASTFEDSGVVPLYLVDGVSVDNIDNINPNDIKSIEILKDASSTAIYGTRGANGVVIITTKSGEAGKPRVDVRYNSGFSTISNKLPQVNYFESRLCLAATDFANPARTLEKFSARTDSTGLVNSTNYYYQDLLTRTGIRNDINVSISGGSQNARYRASVGYIGVNGIILTSYNDKYTGQLNVDYQPWKNLTFNTQVRLSNNKTNDIDEGSVLQGAMRRDPDMIVWYPDGTLIPYYASGGRRNPIQELVQRENLENNYQMSFTQGLVWKFTDWLNLSANFAGDFRVNRHTSFNSKELDGSSDENARKNTGRDDTSWVQKYAGDAYFNFNKTYSNVHTISATLGTNLETQKVENSNFSGSYFVTEAIHTMNMATVYDLENTNTTAQEYSLLGFFGRLNYSYKGRYLLQGSLRRDGSSRFGEKSRWGWFPSGSIGWRFSDESFMQWSNDFLTDGKLRMSYGKTGNDKVGYYEAITRYTAGSYFYNGVGGVVPLTA